jgi:acetyl-CoA carboxylase carboxyltransferase component/biotin carboxyl carrier protein
VAVAQVGPRRYQVTVTDGESRTVFADLARLGDYHLRLTVDGRRHRVVMATHGPVHLVEVDGVTHRVTRDEGGVLRAPAPALVVSTPVAVGEEVAAGAPVLVLESMKMETLLNAPFAGRVRELLVATGSQVETGAPLVRLEPIADDADDAAEPDTGGVDLDLPAPPPDPSAAERAVRGIADLSAILMGFDLDGTEDTVALGRYLAARDELTATGVPVRPAELALVRLFADFAELSRNRPAGEERNVETRVHSPREHFHTYLQSLDAEHSGLPQAFRDRLVRVFRHFRDSGESGMGELDTLDRTPQLEEAVFRVFLAQRRSHPDVLVVSAVLQRWLAEPPPEGEPLGAETYDVLERLVLATQLRFPALGDLARSVRFRWFDEPQVDRDRASVLAGVRGELIAIDAASDPADRARRIDALAEIPEQIVRFLSERLASGVPAREPMLEVLIRRHYREYELEELRSIEVDGRQFAVADYVLDERPTHLVSTVGTVAELADEKFTAALGAQLALRRDDQEAVADLYLSWPDAPESAEEQSSQLAALLGATPFGRHVRRIALGACRDDGEVAYFTFRPGGGGMVEDDNVRGVHPMVGRRLNLWRLRDFDITRVDAPGDVLLYHCIAKANAADQRLVALSQVRQLAVLRDERGRVSSLAQVERAIANCVEAIRRARASLPSGRNAPALDMNHVWVHIWPVIEAELDQLTALRRQIAPLTVGAGIEEVLAVGRVATGDGAPVPIAGRFFYEPGSGVQFALDAPPTEQLKPLDDYQQKVLRARRRGTVYPYELHGLLTGSAGTFIEYDIDETADALRLIQVDRPRGLNKAGIVVGVVKTPTALHPEGISRVSLAGDPTKSLGAVAEAECSRVIAALDLADRLGVPVEWFALSAGARISMDSGTENMDWVARALKRIVEFTQAGGEINVVVAGINVGAQPYWNAEATMLMHTRGVLIMTPESAMVLTGKQSLDFSGGVSAEDNFGIGGYDRVMGPNGQAQYWAADLAGARDILMAHYQFAYVPPDSAGPRRVQSGDPVERDVTLSPHNIPESDFRTVGDIFSPATNPDRKKPFDIRTVMRALADQDLPTLERWAGMADADTAVVQDAYLGGTPVCLLGIESKTVPRHGFPPTDGPDTYTAGTLFPRSSKKAARAINAASGNRPLVVLANLSGFDGSPDSMRNLQLEYGAEIGRAIVNFRGRIVFCVISRYHGGAFVVFSKALNPQMTVLAVEGSFASVIGGAPAAAVVFSAEVNARTSADPRVQAVRERFTVAPEADRAVLGAELAELRTAVRAEKLGEVAAEFDGVHDIHRAVDVGSVDAVISAAELRPAIISALRDS